MCALNNQKAVLKEILEIIFFIKLKFRMLEQGAQQRILNKLFSHFPHPQNFIFFN